MKKFGVGVACAVACVAVFCVTAFAGEWGSQDGKWYYKGDDGKYYTQGKKNIDGKTYAFDYDGWMITGFTDDSLNPISGNDCNAAFTSTFYFGTDGVMHTGWLKVDDRSGAGSEYDDYSEMWFYFDGNGKKVANESGGDFRITNVDGERYAFDQNGVMVQGWGTSSTDKTVYVENGKMATGWRQLVPPDWMDTDDSEDGTKRWFYFKPDGVAVKDCCKRIGSANYLFDANGILKTGLYRVKAGTTIVGASYSSDFKSAGTSSESDWNNIISHTKWPSAEIYYFTVNGMQKGTKSISYSGDKHTFNFGSNGKGIDGVKSGKLYVKGALITSGEEKYAAAYDREGGKHLVSKSGTCTGNGKVVSDSGYLWAVDQGGNIGLFDESEKTEAQAWAKEDNGDDYGTVVYVN